MGHRTMGRSVVSFAGVVLALAGAASVALGQDYGFDWVTIGDVGNDPYPGDGQGNMAGRGGVGYEYRIGRYEVTTGQWLEFVNTFSTQSDDFTYFARPDFWGAKTDWDYQGPGRRYILRTDVDTPELMPVGGISWREAAMFCNWLHNGKSSALSAIEDGAYDTATFTTNGDGTFNDQRTHHADARYWIPTLDEWIKAAHYDPDRYGGGEGGWWDYPISSDEPPVYGVPGEGQANAGFELDNYAQWTIPLGAYEDVLSPWGLRDAAGAAMEWTEEVPFPDHPQDRLLDGSYAGENSYNAERSDRASWPGAGNPPHSGGSYDGLRVAGLIPSPITSAPVVWYFVLSGRGRRRR
ncbi:MAG: SUMF1/EgtB/PvdO family nonheme iron enzyme [Phycisphaerales bacterium]|nr:SUMF1/EgtB/PvdO family nonheme iron enzyme [Phycisphaerales bacterium]